jgi:small-conductance mechanosensitive channel
MTRQGHAREGYDMWGTIDNWRQWLVFIGVLLVAIGAAVAFYYVLLKILSGVTRRSMSKAPDLLIRHLRRPVRWVMILIAVSMAADLFVFPPVVKVFAFHFFAILLIALVIWLLTGAVCALSDIILLRSDVDAKDNLRARRAYTQVNMLRRIVIVAIITIGFATILMTFDRVRQLGTAILASAGIAGIVLGLAAQKTLGNLIAGLQIAFTQPIRIDDVVIVEGEWGRIEEITLTYVVVKIWDLRRLVVPITYFIEHAFQNWTRVSADLLGTVLLYTDYTVPVEAVRAELRRILDGTELWDRKTGLLQVTSASDRTLELRVLVSAPDAGTSWDLRCLIREKLIEFIQKDHPHALPRVRADLERPESRNPDAT